MTTIFSVPEQLYLINLVRELTVKRFLAMLASIYCYTHNSCFRTRHVVTVDSWTTNDIHWNQVYLLFTTYQPMFAQMHDAWQRAWELACLGRAFYLRERRVRELLCSKFFTPSDFLDWLSAIYCFADWKRFDWNYCVQNPKSVNYFIANIAISDLLFPIFLIPKVLNLLNTNTPWF